MKNLDLDSYWRQRHEMGLPEAVRAALRELLERFGGEKRSACPPELRTWLRRAEEWAELEARRARNDEREARLRDGAA